MQWHTSVSKGDYEDEFKASQKYIFCPIETLHAPPSAYGIRIVPLPSLTIWKLPVPALIS